MDKADLLRLQAEIQAEVTRLTDMSLKLADMLNEQIDENRRLLEKLNMQTVQVTTDFGSDIVFATVQLTGSEGVVLDWRMDGRPMDVGDLTPMQATTLVHIAREMATA